MKFPLLALPIIALSACSTAENRAPVAGQAAASPAAVAAQNEVIDDAWIERNGPSDTPREGWVQLNSGWYRSGDACLRYQKKVTAGTPLAAGEGCLEPGI